MPEDIREEILRAECKSAVFSGLDKIIISAPFVEVYNAMDERARRMCMDLLQWMAQHAVICDEDEDFIFANGDKIGFRYGGEWITKEELFNNFL